MPGNAEEWWRGATIYEVYLRSFADSDGDGEGDLPGLTSRLDYIADLGVDAIWLTPINPSPMHDSGYDVSDYRGIDPRFGTLHDFRALVDGMHARGLKLVLDQVYSHSSNAHPWFVESAASRDGPRADWYVWADPRRDGSPPNNWLARFGGVAWEWSAARRQYYLHNFLIEQPDLNVRNPEVQDELLDTMRFWFDLGVDGLRLDVANFYMHDPALTDNPPRPRPALPANPADCQWHVHDRSQPENLGFIERMRAVADEAGGRMLLAEIMDDDQTGRMAEYTAPGRMHTAYSFALLGPGPDGAGIARAVEDASAAGGWPSWALSNHDSTRVATRWGAEGNPDRIKTLQALLVCLRGTAMLYQGEELGLPHSVVPREALRDPEAIRFWPDHRGRDGARTPFPWTGAAPSLGFSTAPGWLPAEIRHAPLAVDAQERDPDSPLNHMRALVALRRAHAALRVGSFDPVAADEGGLTFRRAHARETLVCAFNFTDAPRPAGAEVGAPLAGAVDPDGMLAPHGYVVAPDAAEERS